MVRPNKMKNPKTVPVQVEKEIYEEIMKHIPHEISFADKVREWMVKELESINMEKNEEPHTDPLNLSKVLVNSPIATNDNCNSLDLFKVSEKEVREFMFQLIKNKDWETIRMLNPKASIINEKSVMAFKLLNQMTEEKSRQLKSMQINDPKEYHAYFNTIFDEGG